MPLRKAPFWTDIYYRSVEEYFWRPQVIGRVTNPDKPSKPWSFWRSKLAEQEVALNHILDFLFHIAPQELLNEVVTRFLGRTISGVELVEPSPGLLDDNVVQPDIILSNTESLVFIEMKVDSKSSVDQVVKYAIAASQIATDEPTLDRVDLVILSRHTEHAKIWGRAKKLGLESVSALRSAASKGLKGDASIWSQPGVPRFITKNPEAVPRLQDMIANMGVFLCDYTTLADALTLYASEEPTAQRLVGGVLDELSRRGLIESTRPNAT